jgi:hypothetical protein
MFELIILWIMVGSLVVASVCCICFALIRRDTVALLLAFLPLVSALVLFSDRILCFDKCPGCGCVTNYAWCEECGTQIDGSCPNCHRSYETNIPDFCYDCGTQLKGENYAN